jgi:hypothetical protein
MLPFMPYRAPWSRREFIDENGGGPGLRLRKRQRAKKPK